MKNLKESTASISVGYYSDVLCVWAYVAQIKLDELGKHFGGRVQLSYHFVPVFGDVHTKVVQAWAARGGVDAYGAHVREVAGKFEHVSVHPKTWSEAVPASSYGIHLFLKSAQLLLEAGKIDSQPLTKWGGKNLFEALVWHMRLAFFRDGRNVADLREQCIVAEELGVPCDALMALINNGEAHAALCRDSELQRSHSVQGSPTFLLNDGRQTLYGNVGYRIIEANILELLEHPTDRASWC